MKIKTWHILIIFYIALTVVAFLLGGCSSVTTLHRDCDGRIWKVETRGSCKTVIKQGGEEIEQDNKQEPFINISPEIPVSAIGL